MIYLFETKLSDNKSLMYSLNSIYGLGSKTSQKLCKKLGFNKNLKIKSLSKEQVKKLKILIETSGILFTSDLKKSKNLLFKTLIFIKSYKGLRRIKGLPVRGQRTHTNARTARRVRN